MCIANTDAFNLRMYEKLLGDLRTDPDGLSTPTLPNLHDSPF
jgi:hypothetical protein